MGGTSQGAEHDIESTFKMIPSSPVREKAYRYRGEWNVRIEGNSSYTVCIFEITCSPLLDKVNCLAILNNVRFLTTFSAICNYNQLSGNGTKFILVKFRRNNMAARNTFVKAPCELHQLR